MQFFRKHQKKFILILVIAMIAPLALSLNGLTSSEEDHKRGATERGRAPFVQKEALLKFFALGKIPVLEETFFKTDLLLLIAKLAYAKVEEEFHQTVLHAKKYTPRDYPWMKETLLPDSNENKALLLLNTFHQVREGAHFLPLHHLDFTTWFGPTFSQIVTDVIFHLAKVAEKKGYKIPFQEAKEHLMKSCQDMLHLRYPKEKIQAHHVSQFILHHFQVSPIQERDVILLWQKILTLHAYFQDMQNTALLDQPSYQDGQDVTLPTALIEEYRFSPLFQIKDFSMLLQIHDYFEAISPQGMSILEASSPIFYSLEEIEKHHPELIGGVYDLEIREVSKKLQMSRISLQEVRRFEESDAGWQLLSLHFPALKTAAKECAGSRRAFLDQCHQELRLEVSQKAREHLVHPSLALNYEMLEKAPLEKKRLLIASQLSPIQEMDQQQQFFQKLRESKEKEHLFFSTIDTSYSVHVLQKPRHLVLMPLQRVFLDGVLKKRLHQKLKSHFQEAREKTPSSYQNADGSWKRFDEVILDVGAYIYRDVLKEISPEPLPYEAYVERFLIKVLEKIRQNVMHSLDSQVLVDLWQIEKKEKTLQQKDVTCMSQEELFSNSPGFISPLIASSNGPFFYRILAQKAPSYPLSQVLEERRDVLGNEHIKYLIETFLQRKDDV
ncbi:MAG: hypothetical protein QRY71_04000 [Candidatus Rhabdochlamydia sp.]